MGDNIDSAIDAILDAILAEEGRLAPKKKLVVEAAISCFAQHGFEATSTRMIADKAGVAEATIFRHFNTKKALLMRIVEPVVKRLLIPAVEEEAGQFREQAKGDYRAFIRAIFLSRLAFADRYAPLIRIILQEYLVNEDLRQMLNVYAGRVLSKVSQEAFSDFFASGEIKGCPPDRLLRWKLSLFAGYYINRTILAPGDWDDEAEVDAMLDLIMHGISNEK